jgi:hypothetical protein
MVSNCSRVREETANTKPNTLALIRTSAPLPFLVVSSPIITG